MNIPFLNYVLKKNRKIKGLTQEKTANLIFKSTGTVKRYDTGDQMPESVLNQLCILLNLDLKELLKEQEKENQKNNTNFYNELIEKYKNDSAVKSSRIAPRLRNAPFNYDIESLKSELLNYLTFKDVFLNIGSDETEKMEKIKKILTFIDFLYFQDIVNK